MGRHRLRAVSPPPPPTPPTETRADKPKGKSASVFREPSIWEQLPLITGALTPETIRYALLQADTGVMSPLVDVANEARQKFAGLHNALETRETAIQSLSWELFYPGEENVRRKGTRERRFVEEKLSNHPGLPKLLAHQMGAVYYGYAVSETIWAVDRKGKLYPAAWIHHHPRRFGFDAMGRLVQVDVQGALTGVDFQAKWPGRFIVSQPRITGDHPWREGLMRLLVWYALFGTFALSDWLKLGELIWKPLRLASYEKGASQTQIDEVQRGLTQLSSDSAFTFPKLFEVDIKFPSMTGQAPQAELLRYVDTQVAKGVNGQNLTSESGSVGSQALGNVHNEVRKERREGDANNVWGDISDHVIAPMLAWNFPPMDRPLRARPITDDSVDLESFSTAISKFVDAGLTIPASWVRDRAGMPQPKDGDELLEKAEPTAPAEGDAAVGGAESEKDTETPADPDED